MVELIRLISFTLLVGCAMIKDTPKEEIFIGSWAKNGREFELVAIVDADVFAKAKVSKVRFATNLREYFDAVSEDVVVAAFDVLAGESPRKHSLRKSQMEHFFDKCDQGTLQLMRRGFDIEKRDTTDAPVTVIERSVFRLKNNRVN